MHEAWGHPVHSRRALSSLPEGISVDRKAVIVRNRGEGKKEMAHVGNLGKDRHGCSGRHLLHQTAIRPLIHKSPVPTGTTVILEFLMKIG